MINLLLIDQLIKNWLHFPALPPGCSHWLILMNHGAVQPATDEPQFLASSRWQANRRQNQKICNNTIQNQAILWFSWSFSPLLEWSFFLANQLNQLMWGKMQATRNQGVANSNAWQDLFQQLPPAVGLRPGSCAGRCYCTKQMVPIFGTDPHII